MLNIGIQIKRHVKNNGVKHLFDIWGINMCSKSIEPEEGNEQEMKHKFFLRQSSWHSTDLFLWFFYWLKHLWNSSLDMVWSWAIISLLMSSSFSKLIPIRWIFCLGNWKILIKIQLITAKLQTYRFLHTLIHTQMHVYTYKYISIIIIIVKCCSIYKSYLCLYIYAHIYVYINI